MLAFFIWVSFVAEYTISRGGETSCINLNNVGIKKIAFNLEVYSCQRCFSNLSRADRSYLMLLWALNDQILVH